MGAGGYLRQLLDNHRSAHQATACGLLDVSEQLAVRLVSLQMEMEMHSSDFALLAKFQRLRNLELKAGPVLTQKDLEVLAKLPCLQMLNIHVRQSYLFNVTNLQYTSLSGFAQSPVTKLCLHATDTLLADSAALPNLQQLHLLGKYLTLPADLSGLRFLRQLNLEDISIKGPVNSLRALSGLTGFELRNVNASQVPQWLEDAVSCLASLRCLTIHKSDFDLQKCVLGRLQKLTKLELTDLGLPYVYIPFLPWRLRELNLAYNALQYLPHELTRLSRLTSLNLSHQECDGVPGDYDYYSDSDESDADEPTDRWIYPGLQLDESLLKVVSMPHMCQIDISQYDCHEFTSSSESILYDAEAAARRRSKPCTIVKTDDDCW